MTPVDTSTTGGKVYVMESFMNGESLEFKIRGPSEWTKCREPQWDWYAYDYRIADPYADLKSAHAAGKTIQRHHELWPKDQWEDAGFTNEPAAMVHRFFRPYSRYTYRIKPLEFPAPPEGESWHNPDGLTAEQVEVDKGWRLLLVSEIKTEDNYREDIQFWPPIGWGDSFGYWTSHTFSFRTKLPPPTPKKRLPLEATGVEAEVCQDIAGRQQKGVAKYGTTVADNPAELREWMQHAYEEALDLAIYLKRAMSKEAE